MITRQHEVFLVEPKLEPLVFVSQQQVDFPPFADNMGQDEMTIGNPIVNRLKTAAIANAVHLYVLLRFTY